MYLQDAKRGNANLIILKAIWYQWVFGLEIYFMLYIQDTSVSHPWLESNPLSDIYAQ